MDGLYGKTMQRVDFGFQCDIFLPPAMKEISCALLLHQYLTLSGLEGF